MAYTPDVFADGEAGNTPITAAKLNRLGQGVQASASTADAAQAGLASKADQAAVTSALASKADQATVTSALASKADLVGGKVPAAQLPEVATTSGVSSVNTKTGAVTLSAADVGAAQVFLQATAPTGAPDGSVWFDSDDATIADASEVTFSPVGTIAATTVQAAVAELDSEFVERVQDTVAALIVAGANVTKTYDDTAGTLTIASTAAGGGGSTSGSALLGRSQLNPASTTAYTNNTTTFTDINAGLAVAFTVPASGVVRCVLHCLINTNQNGVPARVNVRSGGVDVAGSGRAATSNVDTNHLHLDTVISGLTPGASLTYTPGFRVTVAGTVTVTAGGASDIGPAMFEVWSD